MWKASNVHDNEWSRAQQKCATVSILTREREVCYSMESTNASDTYADANSVNSVKTCKLPYGTNSIAVCQVKSSKRGYREEEAQSIN